jgi:uncharacterized membrane protein YfcA
VARGGISGAALGSGIVFMLPVIVLKRLFAAFIILTGLHILVKSFWNLPSKGALRAENKTQ